MIDAINHATDAFHRNPEQGWAAAYIAAENLTGIPAVKVAAAHEDLKQAEAARELDNQINDMWG